MILAVCPNPSVDTYLYMDTFNMRGSSRVTNKESYAGGKGIHVAMAIAESGEDVSLLAFWGGERGQWMKEECEKLGIKCFGPKLDNNNRTCITIKSAGENDDTEILENGSEISEQDYKDFIKVFKQNIAKVNVVSMSGSWPPGAPNNAYAEMVKICNENNIPHILDATGIKMHKALLEKPYGIHINKDEAEELFGTNNPDKALKIIQDDIKIVALTAGSKGLYLRKDGEIMHANVVVDSVYSAVGSGDCLSAGLSMALANNKNIEDTAVLATACGAANCLRPELGMLYKEDILKLEKEVKLLHL